MLTAKEVKIEGMLEIRQNVAKNEGDWTIATS